jgi:hypothetical protein
MPFHLFARTKIPVETTPPKSPLLKLPAELRNEIYYLALVETDPHIITITDAGIEEPALLQTSKEVRGEAIQIYYGQNQFQHLVQNQDSDPIAKWNEKAARLKAQYGIKPTLSCSVADHADRPNLTRWLQRYHKKSFLRRSRPSNSLDGVITEKAIIGTMFHLVRGLRGLPWERVEALLEEHWVLLESMNAGWRT